MYSETTFMISLIALGFLIAYIDTLENFNIEPTFQVFKSHLIIMLENVIK